MQKTKSRMKSGYGDRFTRSFVVYLVLWIYEQNDCNDMKIGYSPKKNRISVEVRMENFEKKNKAQCKWKEWNQVIFLNKTFAFLKKNQVLYSRNEFNPDQKLKVRHDSTIN